MEIISPFIIFILVGLDNNGPAAPPLPPRDI